MPIENQVVSLQLAKKLKELGVKQESLFYWVKMDEKNLMLAVKTYSLIATDGKTWSAMMAVGQIDREPLEIYSTFTVAELGDMLPEKVTSWKRDKQYHCHYYFNHENNTLTAHEHESVTDS